MHLARGQGRNVRKYDEFFPNVEKKDKKKKEKITKGGEKERENSYAEWLVRGKGP